MTGSCESKFRFDSHFRLLYLIDITLTAANLASFMVSPQIDVFKIPTIKHAIVKDAPLCVQDGAIIQKILEDKYPGIKMVGIDSEQEIYEGLRDGRCEAVAHQLNTYEVYEHTKEVNFDCAMASEKKVQEVLPAGMATIVDTGSSHCTSLISHVLDYHLTEMLNDGFISRAWHIHLNTIGTINCVREEYQGGDFDGDTFSLTLQETGGE